MNAAPLVQLDGVSLTRDGGFTLSVDGLSIAPGEAVACVGPSGCGKTTLAHLVAGILLADTGNARLDGHELAALTEDRRRALRITTIGMVFQRFALLDHLTGLENVLLPYHVSDELDLTDGAEERARGLAHTLGVAARLDARPERMSQGERQRLAICRALVTRPALLIADEPTGNLDPARSDETIELLVSQAREHDVALFVVTHDHGLLEHFDRILTVDDQGSVAAR